MLIRVPCLDGSNLLSASPPSPYATMSQKQVRVILQTVDFLGMFKSVVVVWILLRNPNPKKRSRSQELNDCDARRTSLFPKGVINDPSGYFTLYERARTPNVEEYQSKSGRQHRKTSWNNFSMSVSSSETS